jgi:hypothetical protein
MPVVNRAKLCAPIELKAEDGVSGFYLVNSAGNLMRYFARSGTGACSFYGCGTVFEVSP